MKSKEWSKKVSIALITAMIVSLMAPMLAWAAMQTSFTYSKETGKVSGSIYVQDPNSVTVNVYKEDGTVISDTYLSLTSSGLYDNQNNSYTSVNYSVYVGEAPASVKVQGGGDVFDLESFDTGADYASSSYSSVTLDVYRMSGNLLLSDLDEGEYVAAGSELFDFTPNVAGANALHFKLPYSHNSHVILNNLELSDLIIEDVTVGAAVYANQLIPSSYWSVDEAEYNVRMLMVDPFIVGHQYKVMLSSEADQTIQLPEIVDNYNHFATVVTTGTSTVTGSVYTYYKKNSLYFTGIELNEASNNSGGYIPPVNSDKQTVNESSLNNGKDGKVAVDIANGTKQVLLPANAAKALGENSLVLNHEDYNLEIPSEVLAALAGLVSEEDLVGAEISFTAEAVADQATMVSDINGKGGLKSANVKSAGEAIDFTLSLITKDGKEHKLEKFSKALTLKLKLAADANAKLAGIYYVATDSSLEFVGGKVVDNEVIGHLTHFSTYAPLEYVKTFDDVSSDFWAFAVIKNMSAKHVVAGVTDSEFVPGQDVTRAQFAAFVVRALELKATGAATFTDVAAGKWYAAEVAAAAEAGIVSGRSAKIFAPEDVISREEMAIMIVNAHAYMTGEKITAAEESTFADASDISDWAKSYVDAAFELGYIKGLGNNLFAPTGETTRAESVQVISLLLN